MIVFLIECPVEEDLGLEDPNNVFHCKDDEKCCISELQPACCKDKDLSLAIFEQLYFWGILIALIIILALIIWWCRSDQSCCNVDKPCLVRFGCKKQTPIHEYEKLEFGSTVSLKSKISIISADKENLKESSKDYEDMLEKDGESLYSECHDISETKEKEVKGTQIMVKPMEEPIEAKQPEEQKPAPKSEEPLPEKSSDPPIEKEEDKTSTMDETNDKPPQKEEPNEKPPQKEVPNEKPPQKEEPHEKEKEPPAPPPKSPSPEPKEDKPKKPNTPPNPPYNIPKESPIASLKKIMQSDVESEDSITSNDLNDSDSEDSFMDDAMKFEDTDSYDSDEYN
ncbi:unnamed protein product [Lepeophtheirus salmonis]|uniref:(salmon louse) hypothetical protein n=1 Tax=Lepeophtheirus salmonis TaxID=72036 RepID=A0A7R8H5L8_LEPSM|nr:unnamed protein product [Lepeophtheirus salmonis]CAF2882813.1 unnamed protein product [Lepeophtheirus salmonis]